MPEDESVAMQKESRKIALGMLSTRMQRAEVSVSGKKPRGPPALSTDPELYSVIVPQAPKGEQSPRRAKQQPQEHPQTMRSHTDLLWHDGHPQPPPGPKPNRAAFARYLPSHNKGKPTSKETLSQIAANRADDIWNRAHAARPPARLAVRMSRNVLEMCKEHNIDMYALMREGANPLRDEVNVIHGPYTPSWEYALGDVAEPGFDPDAPPIDGEPSTARSAPPGSGRKAPGRARAMMRRKQKAEAEREGGSSSARAFRSRPEHVLDEDEIYATQKKVQMEMDELRKRRADSMRRRAAVHLAQQRRMTQSCELEREQEEWRNARRNKEMKKQAAAAAAAKKHVAAVEVQRQNKLQAELEVAEAEAKALRERWAEQEARVAEQKQAVKQAREARAEAEDQQCRLRLELEEKRAAARAMAVAEYEEARAEGEKEAEQRAADLLEQKRQAAAKRVEEDTKRREEAHSKKNASIREYTRQMDLQHEQRIEREAIVDEQMRERREQPHKNLEKHQRNLKRQEAAPLEVERLEVMRERRIEAERMMSDQIVEENRQNNVIRHAQWVRSRQAKRSAVVKRIEKAQQEKMAKTAMHAASVQKYEEAVEKLQAKKALREAIIKQERDEFNMRQAKVIAAVAASERSGRATVIDDSVIEAAIASGRGEKKKR